LAYVTIAAALAVAHDELLALPAGRFGHDCEQVMLGAMLVLGMLGGLLLLGGSRLFENACGMSRRRQAMRRDDQAPALSMRNESDHWDTRSGVALVRAGRAIEEASRRPDVASGGDPTRHPAA
jgi:hypothetical protein